jgi:phosphatidylethanolamine-binding protein (PEBP) family uncharacterized protein
MNKKRSALSIFFLLLMLTACGRVPATPLPPPTKTQALASPLPVLTATSAQVTAEPAREAAVMTLTSPDLPADGRLPAEYTCDGAASTLALAWSGAPAGTVGYAVIMHHLAPETIHWYWVIYDLPAEITSLPKNVSGLGTLGNNLNNGRTEYSPPCSKGPGDKEYIYTVYALSAQPQLSVPAAQVDRATLLEAIQNLTLASAELRVVYARP